MTTTSVNLTVNQGADYTANFIHLDVDGSPLDISIATITFTARQSYDSSGSPDISLSNTDNGIIITGTGNNIAQVTITKAVTNGISFTGATLNLFYNVEVTIGTATERSFMGIITLLRDVNHT